MKARRTIPSDKRFWRGAAFGVLSGYVLAQQAWVLWQLRARQAEETSRPVKQGVTTLPCEIEQQNRCETDHYTISHTIEDGIERIVYHPKHRRFETPIVMQHGMWHGAWCWHMWQALFAEWGWETHAHSLPGHARSVTQRPVARCTLDYYLGFLKAEVERMPARPVLMGHSMGGALTQWYLKYVGDDLPAAVLVAPWVSHSMFKEALNLLKFDPLAVPLMMLSWDASPLVRNTHHGGIHFLISGRAIMSPQELRSRLGPESALVLYQHNPPFWTPPERIQTPMLWIAAAEDPLLAEPSERQSAAHYGADYIVIPEARHNLMMEHNYRETAETIHQWLVKQGMP